MDSPVKPIAIVQGARSSAIQRLFRNFVARWRPLARIVGVVEDSETDIARTCEAGMLRNLADGCSYPLFQDLGAGSGSCALDPNGVVLAGQAVQRDISSGCDLVLLSKFGKLEAENRSGLIPAFVAAMEADVPILTSVSPKYADAWASFAAPFFLSLPADAGAIEEWWTGVRERSLMLTKAAAAQGVRISLY